MSGIQKVILMIPSSVSRLPRLINCTSPRADRHFSQTNSPDEHKRARIFIANKSQQSKKNDSIRNNIHYHNIISRVQWVYMNNNNRE